MFVSTSTALYGYAYREGKAANPKKKLSKPKTKSWKKARDDDREEQEDDNQMEISLIFHHFNIIFEIQDSREGEEEIQI